ATPAAVLAHDPGALGVERRRERLIAELVVERPLGLVAQDLVGLVDLLEALLVRLPRALVRVVLHGELPERLLDGVLVRVACDTEHLVQIARHTRRSKLSPRPRAVHVTRSPARSTRSACRRPRSPWPRAPSG